MSVFPPKQVSPIYGLARKFHEIAAHQLDLTFKSRNFREGTPHEEEEIVFFNEGRQIARLRIFYYPKQPHMKIDVFGKKKMKTYNDTEIHKVAEVLHFLKLQRGVEGKILRVLQILLTKDEYSTLSAVVVLAKQFHLSRNIATKLLDFYEDAGYLSEKEILRNFSKILR